MVYLEAEMKRLLKELAARRRVTEASILRDALARYLAEEPRPRLHTIGESKDALEILRQFASLPAKFIFTSFEIAGRTATKPQRLATIAESRWA